jgi:rhodanese-related sulfurtransferase
MKIPLGNVLALALLPVLSFAQSPSVTDDIAHVLTRAEFDALLAHPEQLLIIDVRRPDEVSSIGGFAAYLSIQAGELEKNLAAIPRDRMIVTVSNHAARAGRAAAILATNGFKVAGALGAENYAEQGGTLVKVAVPPPSPAQTSGAAR